VTTDDRDERCDEPLASALERTTRELRAIASSVDIVEHAVGAMLATNAPSGESHIQKLQSLDLIRQRVAGVADFLDALIEKVPETWRIDAEGPARFVTLADMAARLGGVENETDRANFAPPELYELFD
jgi:hypothetical protein